jgi:uncharacterized protein YkwD
MVNKVALGILAVIILTAMTVGGLVGLQLSDDGAGEGTATPVPTTTATPTPATPDADGTGDGSAGTPTPTATPTPTPTPAVSAGDYNRTLIEEEVRAAINAEREERDMRPLGTETVLREMARNHSRAMAGQGYVTHDAAGFTTADRYEAFGLADRCRIPDNSNSGIREGQALETVDKRTLGANYTFRADGPTVTLRNETVTARAAVDSWFRTEDARQKLLLREAGAAGVGVVLTERGGVYVTVDLC